MTPLVAVAEVLAGHRFGHWRSREGERASCPCGWESEPTQLSLVAGKHAAHVAEMLAAAGVLPAVQEWTVDGYAGIAPWSSRNRDHVASIAEAVRGTVVTRYVTEWVESGG